MSDNIFGTASTPSLVSVAEAAAKVMKLDEHCGVCDEQGLEEKVNLKKLKKDYLKNEDENRHTENYLMLAKAFGTPAEVKKVQEIMKRNEKQGSTSKTDSDWMYKNINKYYDKIRNEEVELDEGYEKEVILSLRDKGIDSGFYKGKLYVAKRDVKKATEILKKDSDISKLPTIIGEEVELEEAFSMGKGDKRVVDAFYDQKKIKAHGASILTTDGKTLTKRGMGGQDIAKWVNGKIKIVAVSDVKSTELILKYMKKSIPSGVFEEVEEGIDIKKASMGDVIKDFKTSDAPQFKGKSDKKKKEMAIAAKLSREENEDDDPVGKSKKKSKKDVINLKPTAESSMKKLKDIMIKMKEKRSNNVDEAVNLKKLKKEYDRNEDKNHHTENYLLLAKAFGTPAEVKKVQEIMKRNEKQGSTSKTDSDWMYKNINKYYDKIRNEEVEVEESDGYEVDLAAKKIQHKWKRMSKAEKVRFLDKMDVLAGKTKVSDSDLEDILSDYGLTMEATGDKEAYEKFFQSALKKFGVKSPAELKGDKKKEFFDYVDKNWTGDHEEQTNKEQTMTKKSLKDAVSGMKEKKSKVTEAMTIGGLEVGEQEFDKGARIDHVAPNLGMTYKDYQAKFETNGLEGPYQIDGGAYFWDKTVGKWFSVETEDYVDDKTNAELNFRYTKGGSAGGGLLYQRSYNN